MSNSVILPDDSNLIIITKTAARIDPRLLTKLSPEQKEEIIKGIDAGIDVSPYLDPDFDKDQMAQIRKGIEAGIDASPYARKDLNWRQMKEIRAAMVTRPGNRMIPYINPEFDHEQLLQIRLGLVEDRDVSIFAKPEFNWMQMKMIRLGLSMNHDVSVYARPELNSQQMKVVQIALNAGVDFEKYVNPEYNHEQMHQIVHGLANNLDVSMYDNPEFRANQMEEIKAGLFNGVDVSTYANPDISAQRMREIRMQLEEENPRDEEANENEEETTKWTKSEINYVSQGRTIATIPAHTAVTPANNLPEEGNYWVEEWPGMSEQAEGWQRNYGFLVGEEDVEDIDLSQLLSDYDWRDDND
jgi:hypothetical protein